MPTLLLNNDTPCEKLHKRLCDISSLRVFGCLCYSSNILAHRRKLDSRVVPGVFLGFKPNTKGFWFVNFKNHNIDLSRNVIFYENFFPYHSNNIQNNDSNSLSLPIPEHYAQTHDDIHMQTKNIVDNVFDNVLEIDTNIEQNETTVVSPIRFTCSTRPPIYVQDFDVPNFNNNVVSTKHSIHSFLNYNYPIFSKIQYIHIIYIIFKNKFKKLHKIKFNPYICVNYIIFTIFVFI